MQGLKQEYIAELESIQQQQAAAQQALRQRFRRLTGDRAASLGSSSTDLGASNKSTLSEQSTAQPAAGVLAAVDAPPAQAFSTQQSASYTAQPAQAFSTEQSASDIAQPAAPYSSGTQGVAANTAQPAMPQTSSAGPSPVSNQPLSASWGATPVQSTVLDQSSIQQPSLVQPPPQYAGVDTPQLAQQPDFAQSHYFNSSMPQERGSSHVTASTPALGDTNQVELESPTYSHQANQEPTPESAADSSSYTAGDDRTRTEATKPQPTRLDMAPVTTQEVRSEQEGVTPKSQALGCETPGGSESDQSMSRNLSDLSKPPRPASSLAGQQGFAKTGQQPLGLGMLHDRSGMHSFFTCSVPRNKSVLLGSKRHISFSALCIWMIPRHDTNSRQRLCFLHSCHPCFHLRCWCGSYALFSVPAKTC